MAHEIDLSTGKAAVFVAGDPPWHGLGTVVKAAVHAAQALQLAHLDWTVEQWPLQAIQANQRREVPHFLANVRTDTRAVLGVVSDRYRIFQNRDAFDFMDSLVGEKLAMFETAGALQGGRRVWILARIPGAFRAGTDDLIEPYVLLVNNHDGSGALRMIPTSVRVVCQNTLNLAMSGTDTLGATIRHYENLRDRVQDARNKLGIITDRFVRFDAELQVLSRRSVNSAWLNQYFTRLLPPAADPILQLRQDKVLQCWRENFDNSRQSLPGIRGTAWGAYNAVSEWADHQRTFRGSDARVRAERRLNSIWFGASDRFKRHAYDAALAALNN